MNSILRNLNVGCERGNLQLLLASQVSQDNCKIWAKSLLKDKMVKGTISSTLKKWLEDSTKSKNTGGTLLFTNYRTQVIVSGLISFAATLEYFLRDSVVEFMRRNKGLRERGYRYNHDDNQVNNYISPKHLENFDTINRAKIHVMGLLAAHLTKGGLFSKKYNRVYKFLDLKDNELPEPLKKSLDSIWIIRNKMAHQNIDGLNKFSITALDGTDVNFNIFKKDTYLPFVLKFVEINNRTLEFLTGFYNAGEVTWKESDPISYAYF